MKRITPEFSRPIMVERVPRGGSLEKIAADPEECRALAPRLDVSALHALNAELQAMPWRGGLKLEGVVRADVDRVSVVSLETFRQQVEFPLKRYFMPASAIAADTEAEIDPIENGEVDLGEAVTETLILELDPYPRLHGETFDEARAPRQFEDKPSPFAALARLLLKDGEE